MVRSIHFHLQPPLGQGRQLQNRQVLAVLTTAVSRGTPLSQELGLQRRGKNWLGEPFTY